MPGKPKKWSVTVTATVTVILSTQLWVILVEVVLEVVRHLEGAIA